MLFIIHLTLNNRNIANQNVFLYVFWHFLSGEVYYERAPKVSTDTPFQAKRSHCLNSFSDLGAGSLYVFWSTIFQMVSRGFTSREFASRSPFAIKFPNPSDTMSACSPPFSLQGFPTLAGHISSYRCARNFDIVKLIKFFFLPLCLADLESIKGTERASPIYTLFHR